MNEGFTILAREFLERSDYSFIPENIEERERLVASLAEGMDVAVTDFTWTFVKTLNEGRPVDVPIVQWEAEVRDRVAL